jgi:hypothetical protein
MPRLPKAPRHPKEAVKRRVPDAEAKEGLYRAHKQRRVASEQRDTKVSDAIRSGAQWGRDDRPEPARLVVFIVARTRDRCLAVRLDLDAIATWRTRS